MVLLIYDGDCRFCRWGIHWIRRFDRSGNLSFCPFGHPVAERELTVLPEGARYESMHALWAGRLYSGTKAAEVVLRQLPYGSVAARLGMHRIYPLIAKHRALLGGLTSDKPAPAMCGDRQTFATSSG